MLRNGGTLPRVGATRKKYGITVKGIRIRILRLQYPTRLKATFVIRTSYRN
jgi:hypothetical protein